MISLADLERDRKFYFSAKRLAWQSSYAIRVGALLANNGQTLAGAFNTVRNPANNVPYGGATFHAERNCLLLAGRRSLRRATLYIARIDKSGKHMPSRPCDRCLESIGIKGVRELVYFDGQFIVKEKL